MKRIKVKAIPKKVSLEGTLDKARLKIMKKKRREIDNNIKKVLNKDIQIDIP